MQSAGLMCNELAVLCLDPAYVSVFLKADQYSIIQPVTDKDVLAL